jgi:hypothetical protein
MSGEELDSKDEGPCRTIAIKEYLLRRLRSYLFISVPVTRVKPAKNYSVLVLIESTVGFTTILPQLVTM